MVCASCQYHRSEKGRPLTPPLSIGWEREELRPLIVCARMRRWQTSAEDAQCENLEPGSSRLRRHILPQFLQPHVGLGVAGRPPVASRRERTAGADLGSIWNGRALELADLEESIEEHFEPLFDRRQVVLQPLVQGNQIRPVASIFITPGVPGQERDFAGAESVTRDEV